MAAKTWNQRTRRFSHSRIDEVTLSTPSREKKLNSASPVGRISVRTQEQRNVKMRFAISYLERNLHHRIQCGDVLCGMVAPGVEAQTIDTRREFLAFRQQLCAPAIMI